jgi:outer membrane protein
MRIIAILLAALAYNYAFGADIDTQPIPDLPLSNSPSGPAISTTEPTGKWRFSLGGGASYAPSYEGAANDRLRFVPLLEASYNDGHFFISDLRGIGYNFSDARDMQYGVRLALSHRRKQSADPHLNGMGDIGFTPEAGLFLNRRFAPWYVSSGITTGSHGSHAELGGGIAFPLSVSDRVRFGINLNWGDTMYNQTYFGVTAVQAAASNNVLTAYNASSGVKDYALTTNWLHNYDKAWFSNAGLSYKWLAGSARLSPLTQRSAAGSANFLAGYRF